MKKEYVPQANRAKFLVRVDGDDVEVLPGLVKVGEKHHTLIDSRRFGNILARIWVRLSSSGVRTVSFTLCQWREVGSDDDADPHMRLCGRCLVHCLRGMWWAKGWLAHERRRSRGQRYRRFV